VEASPLTAAQKLALWESKFDGLRAIQDERAPFRLSGDELHRFTDSLIERSAVERAVADGIRWDSHSPEDEDESDVDVLAEERGSADVVLFPCDGALP
jgi:hypothetical protein